MNKNMPGANQFNLTFCDGWVLRFKKRWRLRTFLSHGGSGDSDVTAAANGLENIRKRIQRFVISNIYNAGEYELNYSMPPDRTIYVRPLPEIKKAKERFTLLLFSNANWSDNTELMIIGNATKPTAF